MRGEVMNTVRCRWRWDAFQTVVLALWVGFIVSLMLYGMSLKMTEWSWRLDLTCVMSLVVAVALSLEVMLVTHWWYGKGDSLAETCALVGMVVASVFGAVDVVKHVPVRWPWTVAETLTVAFWEGFLIVVFVRFLWLACEGMKDEVRSET